MEASALLEKVVASIDVAVFAFDDRARVRLLNDAAERLLGRSLTPRLGKSAADVELGELLEGDAPRVVVFPAGTTERELRRFSFRLEGRAHTLGILTPVEHALRQREREAWQRLLRVLGHEINNSLAPIRSIAESSTALLARAPANEASADLARGLEVIAARAEALLRFSSSFSEVGRLPAPKLAAVAVGPWIERAVALETRVAVTLEPGPRMTDARRRRSARSAPHQPRPQRRRRRHRGRLRRRRGHLVGVRERARRPGDRRRSGPPRRREPLRSFLHDEARRLRDRAGAGAPDRRGPRRPRCLARRATTRRAARRRSLPR